MAAPDAAAPVATVKAACGGDARRVRKTTTADLYAAHAPKTPDEAMRAIWHKPQRIRAHERELFKRFASEVKGKETMGLAPKHAPLANVYGWTQSRDSVIVVVWLQGALDDVTVEVDKDHVLIQTEGYPPVVDRKLFGRIDERVDVENVSWDRLDLVALKLVKGDPGVVWDALFEGDWRLLRAVDSRSYDAEPDGADPLTYCISVFVPEHCVRGDVEVVFTSTSVSVRVAGLVEWRRHFKYPCQASEACWELGWEKPAQEEAQEGNFEMAWAAGADAYRPSTTRRRRRVVLLTVGFADLPRKRIVYDKKPTGEVVLLGPDADVKDAPPTAFRADVIDKAVATRTLFVEDEDGMLCGAVAELAAHLDAREAYPVERLSTVANALLSHIPEEERDQYAFGDPEVEDVEPNAAWRSAAQYDAELRWCERLGRDPSRLRGDVDEPRIEEESEDDDLTVEELEEPPLPMPSGGMLGLAPVRVLARAASPSKAWPLTRSLAPTCDAWPCTRLEDYAFDAGAKNVKVYLKVPFAVTDESIFVEFEKDALRLEVVDAASQTRFYFRQALAHAVDAKRCKAQAKRGDVVLTLRKADAEDAWLSLASTEFAGSYF